MYYEEIDFCIRARALGYFSACVPHTCIIHLRGGTTLPTPWMKFTTLRLRRKNRVLAALKFLPARKLLKLFVLSLPLEFIQDMRKSDRKLRFLANLWTCVYLLKNFESSLYLRNRFIYRYARLSLLKLISSRRTIFRTNLLLFIPYESS